MDEIKESSSFYGNAKVAGVDTSTNWEYTNKVVSDEFRVNLNPLKKIFDYGTDKKPGEEIGALLITDDDVADTQAAIQNLLNLAQDGKVVDGIRWYLNPQMSEQLDLLFRSLGSVNVDVGNISSITKEGLQKWRDLAQVTPVIQKIMYGIDEAGATGHRTLQSLIELEYVKTGNEVMSNQMETMEAALGTTKDVMNIMKDLQSLHNELTVVGRGADPLGDYKNASQKEVEQNIENFFETAINPTLPTNIREDFATILSDGKKLADQINKTVFGEGEDWETVWLPSATIQIQGKGGLTLAAAINWDNVDDINVPLSTNEPYIRAINGFGFSQTYGNVDVDDPNNFKFQTAVVDAVPGWVNETNQYLNGAKAYNEKIDAMIRQFANDKTPTGEAFVQDLEELKLPLFDALPNEYANPADTFTSDALKGLPSRWLNDNWFYYNDNNGGQYSNNGGVIDRLRTIAETLNDQSVSNERFEPTQYDTAITTLTSSETIDFGQKIYDNYSNLLTNIALLEEQTTAEALSKPDSLVQKLIQVSEDLKNTGVENLHTEGTVDISHIDKIIEFSKEWVLDNYDSFAKDGDNENVDITNAGKYQQNITSAITAGQSLNDAQKEEVRRFLFVFEEYYKSAAAMLSKITQLIEKIAQNINR